MKAVFINTENQTVTDIEIDEQYLLENMYRMIGCRYVTSAPIDSLAGINGEKLTLYVDDEGLFKRPLRMFKLNGYPEPLAGNGILLGHDGQGESEGCPISAKHVEAEIGWITTVYAS